MVYCVQFIVQPDCQNPLVLLMQFTKNYSLFQDTVWPQHFDTPQQEVWLCRFCSVSSPSHFELPQVMIKCLHLLQYFFLYTNILHLNKISRGQLVLFPFLRMNIKTFNQDTPTVHSFIRISYLWLSRSCRLEKSLCCSDNSMEIRGLDYVTTRGFPKALHVFPPGTSEQFVKS